MDGCAQWGLLSLTPDSAPVRKRGGARADFQVGIWKSTSESSGYSDAQDSFKKKKRKLK